MSELYKQATGYCVQCGNPQEEIELCQRCEHLRKREDDIRKQATQETFEWTIAFIETTIENEGNHVMRAAKRIVIDNLREAWE